MNIESRSPARPVRGADHPLPGRRTVASFDSATALHAALMAALAGKRFCNLGRSRSQATVVRAAARLPWPLLRRAYAAAGTLEGVRPEQLGRVDLEAVARLLVDAVPPRRYPGIMIGSSNGAMAHLAAALQFPWLPATVLVPVRHTADAGRPDHALAFGRVVAPALLAANPEVVLHQMHDAAQDRLMAARMAYFRVKWSRPPAAYRDGLNRLLRPGAPIILVEDRSRWPVTRVAERHVFQDGGQGGLDPADYLRAPHAPTPDESAAEAEWGADPAFAASLVDWAARAGHPVHRIAWCDPGEPAHPVAQTLRRWYRRRGEPADRLLVSSFVLTDPWQMIDTATVPLWMFFPVRSAAADLAYHLSSSEPYRRTDALVFQHGVASSGSVTPGELRAILADRGGRVRFPGLRLDRSPRDIGALARYDDALADLPPARWPWAPLGLAEALSDLAGIEGRSGQPLTVLRDIVAQPGSARADHDDRAGRAGRP